VAVSGLSDFKNALFQSLSGHRFSVMAGFAVSQGLGDFATPPERK
jgi:hypothetical protein